MTTPLANLKIRRAHKSDIPRMAELSGQLGYPTTSKEMHRRFSEVKSGWNHAVFVADLGGEVIGWLHVAVAFLLELPRRAEINALIVAEGHRSAGAGAKLLDAAEKWGRSKSCRGMSVRSNIIRERAHLFYERHGYEHYKTQKAFRKPLT